MNSKDVYLVNQLDGYFIGLYDEFNVYSVLSILILTS